MSYDSFPFPSSRNVGRILSLHICSLQQPTDWCPKSALFIAVENTTWNRDPSDLRNTRKIGLKSKLLASPRQAPTSNNDYKSFIQSASSVDLVIILNLIHRPNKSKPRLTEATPKTSTVTSRIPSFGTSSGKCQRVVRILCVSPLLCGRCWSWRKFRGWPTAIYSRF
jgi:hypothetical protein